MAARLALLVCAAGVLALPACARRDCVPEELGSSRNLVDLSAPPDAHAPVPAELIRDAGAGIRAAGAAKGVPAGARPYHFLALSGGGMYGAYGIGVLNGWSECGRRPPFDVVTGISVGALFSTFAYLGPKYDQVMRDAMVGVDQREVLRRRRFPGLLYFGALFDPRLLEEQIERFTTPELMAEVVAAHASGRRLYVGTTNIDTRGLIIWDMGAIASRGTPESVELYRKVLLASASVPGALPPVRIPVEVNGQMYEELHVDGGASDEVIFRAFMVADLNRQNGIPGAQAPPGSTLYVINNGKLYAEPSCTRARPLSVLGASYRSAIYGKARDELYRIYLNCLATGVDFRLTAVPQTMDLGSAALEVEVEKQWDLFREGAAAGRQGGAVRPDGPVADRRWRDLPPGSDPTEQAMPRTGTKFATRGEAATATGGSTRFTPADLPLPPTALPTPAAYAPAPENAPATAGYLPAVK